jgi:DNA-directed RNA polymerase specialized sigma24 family protein
MVVGRVEMQWTAEQIAHRFRMPSVDAARVAVSRALKRLSEKFTRKD